MVQFLIEQTNIKGENMSKIIEKLQSFLPKKAHEKISEFEENTFEIIDTNTEEEIGSFSLNEDGKIVCFNFIEESTSGNLSKKEVSAIAEKFIRTFYPGKIECELSAILDLDNSFLFVYEKKDKKYGLFLHSTGFSISVSTTGQITYFYCAEEEFEVRYSEMLVGEEAALEKYVNGLEFELNIQRFDKEVYKNGDNQYHLAYSIIERIMDIPVDGSETFTFRGAHNLVREIQELKVPHKDLNELIGITSEYKLLDKQQEEGKWIEVWSKNDLVNSFSLEMDEPDNHIIKLCFDDRTGLLLQVISWEEHESEGHEIGLERATECSLQMMFKLFPNTHERFRLELLEEVDTFVDEVEEDFAEEFHEEELEYDDEYIEQEPAYTFYFHFYHKGLQVEQHVSYISVGRYTGKITNFHLDIPTNDLIYEVQSTPVISTQEAKEIYMKYVQMELIFSREYNEDGKAIYYLSYVPAFPNTIGHVRAIDAISEKAMYVDVGDATFLT